MKRTKKNAFCTKTSKIKLEQENAFLMAACRQLEKRCAALKAVASDHYGCPARKFRTGCPYPSVCRGKECCVDGRDQYLDLQERGK